MNHLSRLTVLLALAALSGGASAVTLSFDDIVMPAGSYGTPFTVSTISSLGTLEQNATLSFTMTTDGGSWISDLSVSLTDPTGTNDFGTLPGAPDDAGDYAGTVPFSSTSPGSGRYALSFTNNYATAFDLTLSNIRLDVTPAAVPEPASMAGLAVGAMAVLRRRSRVAR
jgi:hypothetical protein